MKNKLIALLLVAFLVMTLVGCTASSGNNVDNNVGNNAGNNADNNAAGNAQEAAEDTFIVGFDQNFPPMGFVGDDGQYTGFDLELAAEAAKRLNKKLVLQPIDWAAKDMELESGNIDCVWNGFTINGREDSYTWTEPYMDNEQVFVVRADSDISTLADLAGKIVSVQLDSSAEAALEDMPELVATFKELVTADNYNTALMDLESGAVDAVAMDEIVANYQIEKRGSDLVVLEESIASEEYGVGFKLGNTELRDQLQAILEEMAADGTMAKISEAWFGKDITTIGK